jgi:hypothetical protein
MTCFVFLKQVGDREYVIQYVCVDERVAIGKNPKKKKESRVETNAKRKQKQRKRRA